MKKNLLLAVIILTTFCQNVFAQKEEVQKALNTFLDTVQSRSYMRDKMDWNQIRQDAKEQTKNMSNTDSLLPVFQHIITGLKDYHSDIMLSKNKEDKYALMKLYATTTYEKQGLPPLQFNHKMIDNKYAYIKLPGVMLEHRRYLDTIQNQLKELDNQNPEAWIIDLTENDGGSVHPMIIPFHSFIDTTVTYSYNVGVDNLGKQILSGAQKLPKHGHYKEQDTIFKLFNLHDIEANKIKNHNKPIILLISNATASSGELATAHFLGQKNVITIGTKTSGLTSGNELIPLTHGYNVNLMTGILYDRRSKTYEIGEGITPDFEIDLDFTDKKLYVERLKYIKESKQIFIDKAIEVLESKQTKI